MKTIVIGIGNPVLTDDSVGIHAARALSARLRGRQDVAVLELCSGGLDLMEAMVGYERAIVIDAAQSGELPPGTVFSTCLSGFYQSRNISSIHNTSIRVALELGTLAGLALPRSIRYWAVEAADTTTFSEKLTDPVQRALPVLIDRIFQDIGNDTKIFAEKSA